MENNSFEKFAEKWAGRVAKGVTVAALIGLLVKSATDESKKLVQEIPKKEVVQKVEPKRNIASDDDKYDYAPPEREYNQAQVITPDNQTPTSIQQVSQFSAEEKEEESSIGFVSGGTSVIVPDNGLQVSENEKNKRDTASEKKKDKPRNPMDDEIFSTGGLISTPTLTDDSVTSNNTTTESSGPPADTTPAEVAITSSPTINIANASSYSFSGTCSEEGRDVDYAIGSITGTVSCASGVWSVTGLDVSSVADNASVAITADHVDAAGNAATQASQNVLKDTVAPALVVLSSPADTSTVNNVSQTITGTCEDGASVAIAGDISGAAFTCASSAYSISATITSGDGVKNFTLIQTDAAGNPSASLAASYTLDTSVPTVTIDTLAVINLANQVSYSFSGTCSEATRNVSYDIGAGAITGTVVCSGGNTWSVTGLDVSSVADNTSLVFLADHDNVALTPAVQANDNVLKDTIRPTPLTLSTPADTSILNNVSQTMTGTCEPSATVSITGTGMNGGPFTGPCSGGGTYSISVTLTAGDGTKNFSIDQADVAGNNMAATLDGSYEMDTTVSVTITPNPGPINIANASSYTVSGTCSDVLTNSIDITIGGSVTTTVNCNAGGIFSASLDVSGLADNASVSVSVDHTDAATNLANDTLNVLKDTVAPAAPTLTTPPDGDSVFALTFNMDGTCEAGASVSIDGTGINGGPFTGTCSGGGTYSISATLTAGDGTKNFDIIQTDVAGNPSTALSGSYDYYSTPPAIAITSSPIINIANAASYTLSGTCSPNVTGIIDIDVGGETASGIDCAGGVWSHTFDVSGASDSLTLAITANYGPGPEATDSTTVLKDTIAPTGLTQTTLADTSSVTDRVVTVGGACEDGATVHVTVDVEAPLGPFTVLCASSAWTLDIALSRGSGVKNINYDQIDAAGNPQATSIDHSYTFTAKTITRRLLDVEADYSCFIHTDGRLFCTGEATYGRLGNNDRYTNLYKPHEVDMSGVPEDNNFLTVSNGDTVTCAVHNTGKVFCWGHPDQGQIGQGSTSGYIMTPVEIDMGAHAESNDFITVDTSAGDHSCGVHSSGQLFCWGRNGNSQLGNGLTANSSTPIKVDMSGTSYSNDFTDVSTGLNMTCGVHATGRIFCWGLGTDGRLGTGSTASQTTPTEFDMSAHGLYDNDFVQVSALWDTTCGLHSSGKIFCTGDAADFSLGNGSISDVSSPVEIDMSAHGIANDFKFVDISNGTGCAVHVNDKLYCWGNNQRGQLGNETNINSGTPIEPVLTFVGKTNNFKQVATYRYPFSWQEAHTCALHADDTFVCTGEVRHGKLGTSHTDYKDVFTEIDMTAHAESNDFIDIDVGEDQSCGIHSSGKVFCWGSNSAGILGNGGGNGETPVEIDMSAHADSNNFQEISMNYDSACGIHATSNKLYCWGYNNTTGGVGVGTTTYSYTTPVEVDMSVVSKTNSFKSVGTSSRTSCGIHTDGSLMCWGENTDGEVGDNSTTTRLSPVLVNTAVAGVTNDFVKVSGGGNDTFCALHSNSKIYCWGAGAHGVTPTVNEYVPMEIDMNANHPGVANSFIDVSATMYNACGIHSTGKVYCWGGTSDDTIGRKGTSGSSTPHEIDVSIIPYVNNFKKLADTGHAFYNQSMCAIHDNDELVCWGGQSDTELGMGFYGNPVTTFDPSPITEIDETPFLMDFTTAGITNNIVDVGTGYNFMCIVHNAGAGSGKIYCAGDNIFGQIGSGQPLSFNYFQLVDMSQADPWVTIDTLAYINASNYTAYTFTGTCSNPTNTVTVSIGGLPYTPTCQSDKTWSVTADTTSLSDGSIAITADHMTATQATASVLRDIVAPATPTLVTPADGSSVISQSLTISGLCEAGALVEISGADLNGGPFYKLCNGTTYTVDIVLDPGLGVKNFNISQTDTVGNSSAAPLAASYTLSSPAIAITSAPIVNLANYTSYTVSGTCTADDTGIIDVDIEGAVASAIDCTGGTWSTTYDLTAIADDTAMNIVANYGSGPLATDSTTVLKDTVRPTPLTVDSPANTSSVVSTSITMDGTCETGATVSISGTGTTGGPFTQVCAGGAYSIGVTLTAGDGVKNWSVDQTDPASNSMAAPVTGSYTLTSFYITNITSPNSDGIYGETDVIDIVATFNNTITISGTPSITLDTGAVVNMSSSTATTITFQYTVGPGENSSDLSVVSMSPGTFIRDPSSNDAALNIPIAGAGNDLDEQKDIQVDTQAPAFTAGTFIINGGATETQSVFLSVAFQATDNVSSVVDFCLKYTDATQPGASDPCWKPLDGADPGVTPSNSVTVPQTYVRIGFVPGTYTVYGFLRDGAGNISTHTATNALDQDAIGYVVNDPPYMNGILVTDTATPADPPTSAELVMPAGADVHIKWNITDDRGLAASPINLYYTTDGSTYTAITGGTGLDNGSNGGCTVDEGATTADDSMTGCFVWSSGAPTSSFFKIRVEATDSDGVNSTAFSVPLNDTTFNVLAGNTDRNIGNAADSAIFSHNTGSSADVSKQTFVVMPSGDMYIWDVVEGIVKIDAVTGMSSVFIPKTSDSTVTGPIASAEVRYVNIMSLDYDYNLWIYDYDRIKKIDFDAGTVTTIIGTGGDADPDNVNANTVAITPDEDGAGSHFVFFFTPDGKLYFTIEEGALYGHNKEEKLYYYNPADGKVYRHTITGTGSGGWASYNPATHNCYLSGLLLEHDMNEISTSFTTAILRAEPRPTSGCSGDPKYVNLNTSTFTITAPHPATDPGPYYYKYMTKGMDGKAYAIDHHSDSALYKWNDTTKDWDKILGGTGEQRGNSCVDGMPALDPACYVDVFDMFVTESGQIYFNDGGAIRTIDENGDVQTLYGQKLDFGDGQIATAARFGNLRNFDVWDNAGTTTITVLDEKMIKFREFAIGGNISTLLGDGVVGQLAAGNDSTQSLEGASEGTHFVVHPTSGDVFYHNGYDDALMWDRSADNWIKVYGDGGTAGWSASDGTAGTSIYWNGQYSPKPMAIDPTNRKVLYGENGYSGSTTNNSYLFTMDFNAGWSSATYTYMLGQTQNDPSSGGHMCAAGTSPAACDLRKAGAWDYGDDSGAFTAEYYARDNSWLMHERAVQQQRISKIKKSTNVADFTTLNNPAKSFTYYDAGANEFIFYCGQDGNLYKRNVTTASETALVIATPGITCVGLNLHYDPVRDTLIFIFEEGGLQGIGEYLSP